jgi:SHS2 domain-containing protein
MPDGFAPFEEIEHAADVGLRARGRSMEELFANAALGMLSLVGCRPRPGGAGEEAALELEGLDPEHLLVRWLSEILYFYREGKRASGFELEILGQTGLKARFRLSAASGRTGREIKLVTHHGVRIEEKGGLFQAEVVFDV